MTEIKHEIYFDEGMNQTGGAESAAYKGEQENNAYPSDAGAGKEMASFNPWKINPRLACRLNNRLRRL